MAENSIPRIATIADLEKVIGRTPPPVNLKVIDHLDDMALRWLEASPLAFTGFGGSTSVDISLCGGVAGFVQGAANSLHIPLAALDRPELGRPGLPFSSLSLVPGIGETLRINGAVSAISDGELQVSVSECYVHCAKALIRSDFWSAMPIAELPSDASSLVSDARFMALATVDAEGRGDLSPKGDPAGRLVKLCGNALWFADRPGNRRADSFRNIISQPKVTAALLIPGSNMVAYVSGRARLTTDEAARAEFEVQGKTPNLATCIEDIEVLLRGSAALARAQLWPAAELPGDINAAAMFAAHVKLNKGKGLGARIASAVVSVPGLMQKGLDKDYKSNLY